MYHDLKIQSTFLLLWCQRNLILLSSLHKICAKHEKTSEFHLYCWNHICKVYKWMVFSWLFPSQICGFYSIIVCNWFSDVFRGYRKATLGCNGYMTLGTIFLQFKVFTIIWTLLLLFTCLLKKPYFSIFHTKYLIIISPHLRPLAKLGCQ